MKHVRKDCEVKGCDQEASYWLDTEGTIRDSFYLCVDHQFELDEKENHAGYHMALNFITGELYEMVIGKYSCDPACEVCADA
jgi:hypothetical protein